MRRYALVPVFLAAQGLLVYCAASAEHPPAPPALAQFPAAFGGWSELQEDPIDPDIARVLRADRLLSRTYVNPASGQAGLLVAWFQSQRAGSGQPHSPQVCLPASGWISESTGELSVSTSAGAITVNRYVVSSRADRAVVLYWYQTAHRAIAGEWAAKFWLVAGAIRERRTDTALVRIVVEDAPGGDERATQTAADFARSLYPLLGEQLPR